MLMKQKKLKNRNSKTRKSKKMRKSKLKPKVEMKNLFMNKSRKL